MEWLEINVYTTAEGIEAVCAVLIEYGINGIQIENAEEMKRFIAANPMNWDYVDEDLLKNADNNVYVKFYLSNTPESAETFNVITGAMAKLKTLETGIDLGTLAIETKNADDEDWKNIWKKYYKPIEIGEKIAIKPEWENYENTEGRIVFHIEPGHIFGTGLHQTTQLCIEQLEWYINHDSEVLDLGCGTGILSIISLMLGAKCADAVDIEHDAVAIAYENARINGIDNNRYRVFSGNVLTDENVRGILSQKKYNIIIANIVADIIIGLTSFVHKNMADGGIFICSGIIDTRVDDVYCSLKENGFHIIDTAVKDDWYCVVSKKLSK